MSGSIFMTISGLIYTLITTFIFIRKRKINKIENRIYKKLLIITILSMLVELLIVLTVNMGTIGTLVQKVYLVVIVIWLACFTVYASIVTRFNNEISDEKNVKKFKKWWKLLFIISAVFAILILVLPIYFVDVDGAKYTEGPSVNTVFMAIGFNILTVIFLLISGHRNTIKKRYLPIYALIILFTATAIIQKMFPELLLMNFNFGVIVWIMFNTIENPDLKMIEELNFAKDQAEKANHAKTEFLSSMSHEIRTPLNAIVGFSNSLVDDIDDDIGKAKEDAKYIVNASQSLLELVNGILDISKIEANKIEIIDVEYNSKELLDNLVALSKARLGEKPIEFRTSFDPSLPEYLYGDSSRIKQIAINLLTNSIKYTKEGFIEFKVSSVVKDGVARIIMSVEDSGIGIKREDIDKLFDKFSRLDQDKNLSIEGSGLGLAITKKLIEMMNGTIVVQSDYGVGSKFTVAIDQRVVTNPTRPKLKPRTEERLEFANKKVLVIDDNKLNLKVAEKVLEPFKVEVTCANSGDEGIDLIKNGTYDIVLLDDMMPGKSGVETFRELKTINPDYNIPTVALTANAITGMKEKYLDEGFDDYLAKPIEKDELKRVLNKYLK